MLGTLLGMGPGTAALAWFTGSAGSLATGPEVEELSLYLLGLGVLVGAVVALRMWLGKSREA